MKNGMRIQLAQMNAMGIGAPRLRTQKYRGRSRTISRDALSARRVIELTHSPLAQFIIDEAATGPGVLKASKGFY
jgi:hypothetical protein